ncbi:MAG: valine--tRNA ligase [Anaerolineae bacterium]|nr:valine--tRNA ligase [Anaerolineae bacterium]
MELAKTYDPKAVEKPLYEWWEKSGFFKPENQLYLDPNEPPFIITIPPPNVTGTLHMGHALTSAIEDLMVRYHRMKGARTLWVPGTDHAGIATQAVVERELAKRGISRRDLTREAFLKEAWAWKEYSHRIINTQQRALGISVDWDREAFTMDEARSLAVRTAFKMLYDRGLIYRDTRMINWDPVQLTSVSDLEVEFEEEGEPGFLYYVRYPLQTNRWQGPQHPWGSGRWAEGATEWITIATTRPETILGDTAVMVNPEDDRYTHLVACRAVLPVIGRELPIISDPSVDMHFGTGAVKVTPAHDFTDYEVGKRHHLPFVEVMDEHARMNENAGPYAGLDRFECRKQLVADLEKEGLLVKVEPYMVRLGRGQRSGAVIEPRISLQWFCDMKRMAQMAADAVREGRLRIVPKRFEKTWFDWLDNIKDWCLSRQLWWGHQIPVWYVVNAEALREANPALREAQLPTQYCELTEEDAYRAARRDWGEGVQLEQDPDVLDTWFSSGLWPFSTLGWPQDTPDMRAYYPTTMLETGYDILFFWVARMVMLGLELTGKLPFTTVYLHGLIRTSDGKKMSKSHPDKIIDPLELIDTYGTDAVRFFLVTAGAPGGDVKMDAKRVEGRWRSERIEGARNFANKLWNAARFVIGKLEHSNAVAEPRPLTLPDRWILARLAQTVQDMRRLMDHYEYGEAGRLLYDFIWGDYCDWYLECSKVHLNAPVLVRVLDAALRLLHPFMPFVTEALWQKLKEAAHASLLLESFNYPSIMLAPYPRVSDFDAPDVAAIADMAHIQEAISVIRNVRTEYGVAPGKRVRALFSVGEHVALFEQTRDYIAALAQIEPDALIAARVEAPAHAVSRVIGTGTIYLPLGDLVDIEAERKRLSTSLEEVCMQINRLEALLASEFSTRAPAHLVEKERARLEDLRARKANLEERLQALSSEAG